VSQAAPPRRTAKTRPATRPVPRAKAAQGGIRLRPPGPPRSSADARSCSSPPRRAQSARPPGSGRWPGRPHPGRHPRRAQQPEAGLARVCRDRSDHPQPPARL